MKFLSTIFARVLLIALSLGTAAACSSDEPAPGPGGSLTIRIDEVTADAVTFTLASTEQPAPTMYAYMAVAKGTAINADDIFEQGTRQSAAGSTFTLKALDEDMAYTLYAVSMSEAGLSNPATADFTTPVSEWGPETERSMGVQINKVTETGANFTYMLGTEATLGLVAVWPRVVLENYVFETLKLDETGTLTEKDIVASLLLDEGYGQFVSGDETVDWSEELWPDADYTVLTLGMIDEQTPGDAQLTPFTTKAFPLIGNPSVEVTVADKNFMKAWFHYEVSEDTFTYLRYITLKSEIDEYLQHFSQEDLREFIRFSDPMWIFFDQSQSKTETFNFGWEAAEQWFTALAVAADRNLSISKNLSRADVQLDKEPIGTEPATYACHAYNIGATNCDIHFDVHDNCLKVYFRVIPPSAYEQELAQWGELMYSRILSEEAWCYFREGEFPTPESPIANNDDIWMDLSPDSEYVIVATAVNWDGLLSGVTVSEPFRTKPMTYENSTASATIEMDRIDKYSARAIYRSDDKTRVLYHAILEADVVASIGGDSEIIRYLIDHGNRWSMVNPDKSTEWDPEVQGMVWTWHEMTPDMEYVYLYCAEDVDGAVTALSRTSFRTLPVRSGPNPDVTISVYDITPTTFRFDIIMNDDVRDYRYLTIEEGMLNYDPETGTKQDLEEAVYNYVLAEGIKGFESQRGVEVTSVNPGKNYYTGVIAYGSETNEKFRYMAFSTPRLDTNAAMRSAHAPDARRLPMLPGGEALGWDARRAANLNAVDRSDVQERTRMEVEDGKNSMNVLLQEGFTPISLKNAHKSMTRWR